MDKKENINNKVFNYDKKLINFPKFSKEEIKEAFDSFDISSSGTISAQELKFIFKSLGEEVNNEEVDEMIKLGDIEGLGTLNFKHFEEFITNGAMHIDDEDI